MKYYSTNGESPCLSFAEALLQGQAPDRGLYMPERIPLLSRSELQELRSMKYYRMATYIAGKYIDDLPERTLLSLAKDAYDFEIPVEHIAGNRYVMRLDRGPTASFKDFAARLMGRLMNYYLEKENRNLVILTATSGDTGSAIAHAFLGLERIKIVVLFPVNEVTARQRKQMSTLGQNITVLGLDAKFDDCQALVKEAFSDSSLQHLNLSSANSINIGRLIPQVVYYFHAWSKVPMGNGSVLFSVPSGNFGDMMGGVMAMRMGLPVEKFIIAVNGNDEFPRYLSTGRYEKIEPSRNCLSSAMNVGHPSNLARLTDLYGGAMNEQGIISKEADMEAVRRDIWSCSVSDEETRETIRQAWQEHQLLLEPHGAVGWNALHRFLREKGERYAGIPAVVLETAHPAKFPEQIRNLLNIDPELPPALKNIEEQEEKWHTFENRYGRFREFLLENY